MKNFKSIKLLIFNVVALAMGVAVLVLNILSKIDTETAIRLLSIAVISLGINLLEKDKND